MLRWLEVGDNSMKMEYSINRPVHNTVPNISYRRLIYFAYPCVLNICLDITFKFGVYLQVYNTIRYSFFMKSTQND